jgi:hypothetical protein
MNKRQRVMGKETTGFKNGGFMETSQLHNGGFGHI